MKRRRLGQHYLTDSAVAQRMIGEAQIRPEDRVLEIGTGKGFLTKRLTRLGSNLLGYEIDAENYRETLEVVSGHSATIRLGNAFLVKPKFDVLISSLPYSESSTFIEWISQAKYRRGVVLLQADFVRKLLTPPGSRDYRGVSVIAQVSSEINVIAPVAKSSFSPPPKVESAIVSITPRTRMSELLISRIKRLFSLRRRMVTAALADLGFETAGQSFGTRRVYSLTPGEVMEICRRE